MPLTKLDSKPALIVIDLQKGMLGVPLVHDLPEIVDRVAQLARGFRERSFPVVLVTASGRPPGRTDVTRTTVPATADWTDLLPQLDSQPGDLLLKKQCPGAFLGTRLDELLRARGVTQVFLAGVATSLGVEATARSAYDLGYNVVFLTDAMTDLSAESHRHSLIQIFPRLGESDSSLEVLSRLSNYGH